MIPGLAPAVVGVAGELSSSGKDIVPARGLGRCAQKPRRLKNHARLAREIIGCFRQNKGKIQVSKIVIHRPTPGKAAGQMPAVCPQAREVHLPQRVLVMANHHRVVVLPQVEKGLILPHAGKQMLLQRKVAVGVGAAGLKQKELHT